MKNFYYERKKEREERIVDLKEKIDFLIEREPNILSFLERIIKGLWIVSKDTNRDFEKILAMSDLNIMEDREQIKIIKQLTLKFSMKERIKRSERKLNCESK